MRNSEKKAIIKLSIIIVITVLAMTIFSIPLFGVQFVSILIPGRGIWKVTGEVPIRERLKIPELNDEVTVIRDEWGIPHIYASNDLDLFFAQGYVHAQDRFFQMDMLRRLVRGKMSEILGSIAISTDQFNLALGLEYWAIKTDEILREMQANGTIDFLPTMDRYVDGINYYLETHKQEKPLEYYILGFEPTEWTLVDSLCLVQEMARQMSWNYNDLYRLIGLEALGFNNYSQLFNVILPYQIPILPNYGVYDETPKISGKGYEVNPLLYRTVLDFLENVKKSDYEKKRMESQNNVGSNNWVVNGAKSNTGKPILANDMHLAWMTPGVWYEQHLISTETDINSYGFSIPGMPLIAVGHNQYVGWGFTNTGYDVLDWYYYDIINETHYIFNNTETEFITRNYNISVRDSPTKQFTVRETVHGPVISDFSNLDLPSSYGDIILAPQWTANDIFLNLLAGNGFNRAKNRTEFDEASQYWDILPQNIIYADVEGNIAIRPTGKVPIREDSKIPPGHLGNGTIPYNGSNGEGEWIGYIPFEDLPNTTNPTQNYLASANQIIAGPNWNYSKYFLQNEYSDGYRARRINNLLSNAPNGTLSVEKMKEYQFDVNSTAAQIFIPYLINAIKNQYGSTLPPKIDNVLTILEGWKYNMAKDLAAPTIYHKWRVYFMNRTFNDEFENYGIEQRPRLVVLEYLMKEKETSHWFDNVNTLSQIETRNEIMLLALNDTINWLEDFYGSSNPSTWKWGEIHKYYFPHITDLNAFSKGPYPGEGEEYTLNPSWVNIDFGVGFAQGGASGRMILDFSNLNNSVSVIASGERGFPNSKHYSDQLEQLFLQGKYHIHYFGYTANNFPKSAIESTINFIPNGGG